MVAYALDHNKSLDQFRMEEFKACSPIFEEDVYDAISMETCVNGRSIVGGPAVETVKRAIAAGRAYVEQVKSQSGGQK